MANWWSAVENLFGRTTTPPGSKKQPPPAPPQLDYEKLLARKVSYQRCKDEAFASIREDRKHVSEFTKQGMRDLAKQRLRLIHQKKKTLGLAENGLVLIEQCVMQVEAAKMQKLTVEVMTDTMALIKETSKGVTRDSVMDAKVDMQEMMQDLDAIQTAINDGTATPWTGLNNTNDINDDDLEKELQNYMSSSEEEEEEEEEDKEEEAGFEEISLGTKKAKPALVVNPPPARKLASAIL
jgi:hypothetical protein